MTWIGSLSRDVRYTFTQWEAEGQFLFAGTNVLKKISRWGGVGKKNFLLMPQNASWGRALLTTDLAELLFAFSQTKETDKIALGLSNRLF